MNLVGLMGGRIRVRSRARKGSVFEFPITREVVRTSEAVATGADTTLDPGFAVRHPLRILLVEDNPVNQIVAMQMLTRLGYEAVLAGDGESAVRP